MQKKRENRLNMYAVFFNFIFLIELLRILLMSIFKQANFLLWLLRKRIANLQTNGAFRDFAAPWAILLHKK